MPSTPLLTSSLEDYLETIYLLTNKQESGVGVRLTDIAASLNVKTPSVHTAIRQLSEQDLLAYKPYAKIKLTKQGTLIAKQILHRHTQLKQFFTDILFIPEDVAEDNACKIEHIVSPETISHFHKFRDYIELLKKENIDIRHNFKTSLLPLQKKSMQTKIQLIKAFNKVINTDEATKKKLYLLGIQEDKVVTIFQYIDIRHKFRNYIELLKKDNKENKVVTIFQYIDIRHKFRDYIELLKKDNKENKVVAIFQYINIRHKFKAYINLLKKDNIDIRHNFKTSLLPLQKKSMQTKTKIIKVINTDEATKKKLYLLGIQEDKVVTIFQYIDIRHKFRDYIELLKKENIDIRHNFKNFLTSSTKEKHAN